MKASVKEDCIGCGLCTSICPKVFRLKSDGLAEAYAPVTKATEASAKEAATSCPVSVIILDTK